MKAIARTQVEAKVIDRDGGRAVTRSYLGGAGAIVPGPQAVIVEMHDAGARIEPHFHDVDQFQIFIGGSGSMGKHPVTPVSFHYADAFTPYGPIVAGCEGISWFTLRLAAASAVYGMPECRHMLQGKPGRALSGTVSFGLAASAPVLGAQDDGLAVTAVRLAPNGAHEPAPAGGGGQFLLICRGTVTQPGMAFPRLSLFQMDSGELSPHFAAGPEGADILMLQFARPSGRRGSDPSALAARSSGSYDLPPGWKPLQ